ncbi:CorA family divalent cation transporter [Phenylobacterium sp.]|uniref:CorA family divalent cation transporter n=1 Tax=Phenylobacterium sp. TaxID=1871053 RepID=UPI0025F0C027|nr:CorA family divalent cation transporter [Phenylobacterium sp.]
MGLGVSVHPTLEDLVGPRSGLLCAYRFGEGGVAQAVTEAGFSPEPGAWTWAHLALGDLRSKLLLDKVPDLPADARALFLQREDRVQLEQARGWVFGVLPDLERDLDGRPQGEGRLVFALDGTRLITGRLHALRAIDDLRREVDGGQPFDGPAAALARLVEHYVDRVEQIFEDLGAELSRVEDYVLTEPQDLADTGLAPVRRSLSRYRREVQWLRGALTRAYAGRGSRRVAILGEWLPDLVAAAEDLDREAASLQERARLLHEEVDTLITNATNRAMRTLTVISTLLIPPTLITGAFGMNLGGIPFAHSPSGFFAVALLCLGVVAGLLWMLRRMDML